MDQENNKNSYLNEIKKLSVAERIVLVENIWDSIVDSNQELSLSQEQKEELDKRLEEYEKNPNNTSNWEEVKKTVRSKK